MSKSARSNIQFVGSPPRRSKSEPFAAEVTATLTNAIAAATPRQRLTLLTLIEHPQVLSGVERIIDTLSEGLR
jgi:hypothetical protein